MSGVEVSCVKVHDLLHGRAQANGLVVFVDRLWPRGVAKADFAPEHWFKDVAPSPKLRSWFGHKADNFEQFRTRYFTELDELQATGNTQLETLLAAKEVTLLFAAHSRVLNHAVVLGQWLEENA